METIIYSVKYWGPGETFLPPRTPKRTPVLAAAVRTLGTGGLDSRAVSGAGDPFGSLVAISLLALKARLGSATELRVSKKNEFRV